MDTLINSKRINRKWIVGKTFRGDFLLVKKWWDGKYYRTNWENTVSKKTLKGIIQGNVDRHADLRVDDNPIEKKSIGRIPCKIIPNIEIINSNCFALTIEELKEQFKQKVELVFTEGIGLRRNNLKKYTGKHLAILSRFAVENVCNIVFGENNWVVNGDYIHDENGYFDSQRLDDHIWYKNKIVMVGESRAWMDKPFCNMKYGVINTFLTLPHTATVTHPKAFFPILTFAYDVTQQTFHSMDYSYRLYDRVKFYNLSGHKRDSKADYFYRGFSESECNNYIDDMYNHLIMIKENC